MKDYSKNLKGIKESTDSVFEGVLGYKAGKIAPDKGWNKQVSTGNLKDGLLFKNEFLEVNPDESVTFTTNGSTVEKVVTGWSSLTGIDYGDENYRWLVDDNTKFKCQSMSVRNGAISFLRGEWNGGEFRGQRMYSTKFNRGFFSGKKFEAGQWNVHPFNFIRGAWDVDGSILGMNDIESLNQDKFKFNIIAVKPGNKISLQTQDGKLHEVTILKRLDSKSSDFSFKVKGADDESAIPVNVKWSRIRGASKEELIQNTLLSNSSAPKIFTDIFGLELSSPIIKVSVGTSTEYADEKIQRPEKEKSEEELATTQQSYDLMNAPFIGVKSLPDAPYWNEKGVLVKNNIGRVYFNAPDASYLKQFTNVTKNLDNKVIESDFRKLKSWLDAKAITGAPEGYPWLANLIGEDTTGRKIEDERFIGSLNRIEAFLRYFVDIIVQYAGKKKREKGAASVSDDEMKELIKKNLRNYLGVNVAEQPQNSEEPKEPKKNKPKGGIKSEGVVGSLRKIISENMKHF